MQLEYGVPTDRSGVNVRFGIEKGFFADEGLNLSIRIVFGGPEIAAAYDSGDLKIGELGTPPGLTAIARGHRFKIIASGLPRGVGLFFLVRPEIENWKDLCGHTLGALSIGSCSYWYLREMLSQNGVRPDQDVKIRGLGEDYPRQFELLASGEIAGLLSPEPNGTIAESRELAKCWGNVLDLADVPELQWSIQVANEEFLRECPETVSRFLRASRRSSEYLAANPEEWIDFSSKLFGLGRDLAAISIARERPTLHFSGELDWTGLGNAIRLQHHLGAIPTLLPSAFFVAESFCPTASAAA